MRAFLGWLGHFLSDPVHDVTIVFALLVVMSLVSLTRRRLCVQQFDGGDDAEAGPMPASVLRALIRVEIQYLALLARRPDGRPIRIDQAGPYEDTCDLGSLTDQLPTGWKQLAAIVSQLMSRLGSNARLVSGTLLPQTRIVLGIETIHGKLKRTDTIRHQDLKFPDPDRDSLGQLALPAAAWIILNGYPGTTLGGTQDWRSYTDFAAGYAWQQRNQPGDLEQARRLYRNACRDPWNTAAAVNLAALEQFEEQSDPAAPANPLSRPSTRRLSAVVEANATRSAGQPDPARYQDLQWYRAHYLLSSGLRDYAERQPDPADHEQRGPDFQAATEAARKYAVTMARALEDMRDRLPADFVRFGRAAALTLVARQAFPAVTSGNADELAVANTGSTNVTDADIRADLDRLSRNDVRVGTAERLVQYVQANCRIDDQASYNLAQYHEARARILDIAVSRWDGVRASVLTEARQLAVPAEEMAGWDADVVRWQDMLRTQLLSEQRQIENYAQQVVAAGDPVLADRAATLLESLPTSNGREQLRSDIGQTAAPHAIPPNPPQERPDFLPQAETHPRPQSEDGGSAPITAPSAPLESAGSMAGREAPSPAPPEGLLARLARRLPLRRPNRNGRPGA